MSIDIQITDDFGGMAVFIGTRTEGTLSCNKGLRLIDVWPLNGEPLAEVVAIDHPAFRWLDNASIVAADSDGVSTVFQLSY